MPELNILGATEQNRYYPYQSTFRVTRSSFWQAGQDSFTSPPAQNPDMFQGLLNVEPILEGDIQRRRGYSLFSNTLPSVPFEDSYAFRSEILNLRRLVWTSTSTVVATDEAGNVISSPLFTPSLGASAVRMVLSRSYGYFADGIATDYKKWDGTNNTGNLTNWGIAVSAQAGTVSGPNPPGTAANQGRTVVGQPAVTWSNPNNIKVADGAFATAVITPFTGANYGSSQSAFLIATNYSFSGVGAGAQVTGIQVDVKGLQTFQTSAPNTASVFAWLTKDGTNVVGSAKQLSLPLSNGFIAFGGPSDSWGQLLVGSDVNASTFGVVLEVTAINDDGSLPSSITFSVDFVQITVFVSGSSITLGSPSSGGITLLSGRIYTVAFTNSVAGTVSTVTPFSSSTGPLSNNNQPLTGLPVSTDTQVDQKFLLATADGGDETTLYLVAEITNSATTYTDDMADSQLLLQPIFQQTDVNGNLHGVINNLPPPLLSFPVKHKGRIFGAVGPTLYFSKNLDDVTTSTGTITSKWEEAFPATYSLDISERAETVSGLLSDGQTLYIATDASIRKLLGDSPDNFQEPEVIFNETGVINQETWQIVFTEGQPVGSMWLTPDSRVMFSDFNSYTDIGTPIQDVLSTINRNAVQGTAHACFVSDGPSEYYMLYIPTGTFTTPNTVCVYNLRAKKWCIWKPTDKVTTSLFNIRSDGTPQWLFASQLGPLYFWDGTTILDQEGVSPTGFPVTGTSSWLDFGDPGLTKSLNKVVLDTGDPLLTIAVSGVKKVSDITSASTLVIPTTPVQQEAFGDYFIPAVGQPGGFIWYQLTFNSPATSIVKNVLSYFDVEVMPSMRI